MLKSKKEKLELIETLRRSEAKIYSCGCPYLAFSDELGYITAYAVRNNADLGLSNFGRMSVRKMLKTGGFSTKYAQRIYEYLENGLSLHEIAEELAGKMLYKYEVLK
tara:strand:+ start:689 stop:1009 length:321 start_codon:yes stop_codon:yes gene_type:complete